MKVVIEETNSQSYPFTLLFHENDDDRYGKVVGVESSLRRARKKARKILDKPPVKPIRHVVEVISRP